MSFHNYDFDSDTYNIEHILPENPQEGCENFTDSHLEQFTHRLGNMTIIRADTNRDMGNKSYVEKKNIYANSDITITKKIAEDNNEWTIERITKRQRWLADQAVSI